MSKKILKVKGHNSLSEDENVKAAREKIFKFYKETERSLSDEYLKPEKVVFNLSKSESSTLSDSGENRRKILSCSKSINKRKYDNSDAESDSAEKIKKKSVRSKSKYNGKFSHLSSKQKHDSSDTKSYLERKSTKKRASSKSKRKHNSSDAGSYSEEKLSKKRSKGKTKSKIIFEGKSDSDEKRKAIEGEDVNGFTHKKKPVNFREMLNRIDKDDRPQTNLEYGLTQRVCPKCFIVFKDKDKYENHVGRDTDCTERVHGNTKSQQELPPHENICKICDPEYIFGSKRNYEDHLKTKKHLKNVEMNGGTIDVVDKSVYIYIDNRTIIYNYSVYPFFHYDIADLTMYQQLGVLTDIGSLTNIDEKSSPYVTLLSILNLNKEKKKYHNIYCTDPLKKKIRIFDGTNERPVSHEMIHTKRIVEEQRKIICDIYNRFRFFISRSSSVFSSKYLFDGLPISDTYPQNNKMIKRYICDHVIGKSVLPNENTPVGEYLIKKSLSKHFTWKMTLTYITVMEQIGVDFSHNINKIARRIKKYINTNEECASFFVPLFVRFEHLRKKMVQAAFGYAANNSDISGNEMFEAIYMGPSAGNCKPFKKVALDDHSSYVSQNTFYGSKASGVPFYDICVKLDSKVTTDPKYLTNISKLITQH